MEDVDVLRLGAARFIDGSREAVRDAPRPRERERERDGAREPAREFPRVGAREPGREAA